MKERGFDQELLDALATRREVTIQTVRPDGTTRRTVIWIVVVGGRVYVRSWKGDRGYWYQAARDEPDQVALVVGDRTVEARAIPADDDESIRLCSAGLEAKYSKSRSLPFMLAPDILHATVRLEPRTHARSTA